MLFNSIEFAIFFPVVTILFFLLPHKLRWFLLLAASCFFYMFFKPVYIFILFFTIIIDYFAGIWIAGESIQKKRRLFLVLSLVANIGVLVVFKYFNFLATNFNEVFQSFHVNKQIPLLKILLPIGLSFHTFQAMSYTIEVYKGRQAPEKHFGIYALYVMFYPQLVAGPIERPQNMLHQFREEKRFNYDNMREGLILMAWGLFKKVVIADRLSIFVSQAYGNPAEYTGWPSIIGTLFFSFQIFCDFSGYSDIAIGSAKCMGFTLMSNFDRPYMSLSIGEFWRRWHISLSTWFRDYVYIPLGGNKVSSMRKNFNLFIVFLLSGIWHGANWTFVIWGMLHGFYLVSENFFYSKNGKLKQEYGKAVILIKRLIVFLLVGFAWIFFRSQTVSEAFFIIKNMFSGLFIQSKQIISNQNFLRLKLLYLEQSSTQFFLAITFIALMMVVHYLQGKDNFALWVIKKSTKARWSIYYVLVLLVVLFGVFNHSDFIYFQF